MNILVCAKQVPDTDKIEIDPVTNTLVRDGVPSIINPYDGYALEAAARIRDDAPDTAIWVLSMGPPQAEAVLRECLAIAADRAYLVTDKAFSGSDTLATSYILGKAVRAIEGREGKKFDAVFCGKQAIDGETAQVGPELAEFLDYPQVTCAVQVSVQPNSLHVCREAEIGKEIIGVKPPCLVTFTKPSFEPRFPTIKRKMAARGAQITCLSAADLVDIDLERVGWKGSPTKVKRTFVPPRRETGVLIRNETGEQSAKELYELLNKAYII